MNILKRYEINFYGIHDTLLLYSPSSNDELRDMYLFRYNHYLKHGYIEKRSDCLDIDEYDNLETTYYINVFSDKQNRILGSLRVLTTNPLPILNDCFDFGTPLLVKLFAKKKTLEIGRLIVEKYSDDLYLPRHLIMFLLIDYVLCYAKKNKIFFGYAFIKESLLLKLRKAYFPLFIIRNYNLKYKEGVLKKYFSQTDNRVIPVYFNYFFVKMFLMLFNLKNKKIAHVIY